MATPSKEDLEYIKQLIGEIKASGGDIPTGLEVVNIKSAEDATKAIRILNREVRDMDNTFSSIQQRIQNQGAELTKSLNPLNLARSSYKKISNELEKILRDHHGITDLNSKELNQIKQKVTGEIDNMNRQAKRLQLEKLGSKELNEAAIKRLIKNKQINQEEAALLRGYNEGNHFLKGQIDLIDQRIAKEKDYTEILGIAGNSAKALDGFLKNMGLGNVSEFLNIDDALESSKEQAKGLSSILEKNAAIEIKVEGLDDAKKKAGKSHLSAAQLRYGFGGKELMIQQKLLDKDKEHVHALGKSLGLNKKGVKSLTKMGAKTQVLKSLGKNLFKNLGKRLHDPLFYIQQMVKALAKLDKFSGDTAKSMNVTVRQAKQMHKELNEAATVSGDMWASGVQMGQTQNELNSSLGLSVEMNESNLRILTKLGIMAGFDVAQKQEINKLMAVSGQHADDFMKSGLGTIEAMSTQKGLMLNAKQIFKDMLKASNSVKASLGGSVEKLTAAAVEAKALGTTLAVVEGIMSGLIDIENSFKKELEAELLIGRDLNLERARALALANDYAGVAKEINREVGSLAQFEEMNVIQQQKLAEAVGMTREQLSGALLEQEAMEKLSGVEGKNAKEKFDNLVKEVGMAEAKKRLGNEALASQFEQVSVQERMGQAMLKLQEVFLALADPVMAIVEPLVGLVTDVLPLINILLQPLIAGFQFVGLLVGTVFDVLTKFKPLLIAIGIALLPLIVNILIGAAGMIMQAFSWIPVVGPILGAAFLVGTFGGIISTVAGLVTGNDVFSPGTGESGYGSRTLFGPEGAIALNNKDTIIAGTDLFQKGNDVILPPVQKADDFYDEGKLNVREKQTEKQTVEVNSTFTISDPYNLGWGLDTISNTAVA
jgi:hypothetical protein